MKTMLLTEAERQLIVELRGQKTTSDPNPSRWEIEFWHGVWEVKSVSDGGWGRGVGKTFAEAWGSVAECSWGP